MEIIYLFTLLNIMGTNINFFKESKTSAFIMESSVTPLIIMAYFSAGKSIHPHLLLPVVGQIHDLIFLFPPRLHYLIPMEKDHFHSGTISLENTNNFFFCLERFQDQYMSSCDCVTRSNKWIGSKSISRRLP